MCNTMDSDRPVHLVDFPHCGSQQRLPLPRSTRIPTVRLCTFDVRIIKHFSPKINPVRPCIEPIITHIQIRRIAGACSTPGQNKARSDV